MMTETELLHSALSPEEYDFYLHYHSRKAHSKYEYARFLALRVKVIRYRRKLYSPVPEDCGWILQLAYKVTSGVDLSRYPQAINALYNAWLWAEKN